MFVMIGFDDNPEVDPMTWIVDHMKDLRNPAGTGQAATFDGEPARAAFYSNGKYFDPRPALGAIHHRAQVEGHEIGNHTHNHFHGSKFSRAEWAEEMEACRQALRRAGIKAGSMAGFRTPFLEYNAATFEAVADHGFLYDTTLEEGWQEDQDGTNFLWPYTLDRGSPGNALTASTGYKEKVGRHPGLWEIPLHAFMVPGELHPSLTARLAESTDGSWSGEIGKITGLDWNVLEWAGCDGPEFYAILRHTLALRLAGNRAPLMIGGHTALYPVDMPYRRKALEDFLAHALQHPDVRVVTPLQLIAWLRDPVPLRR